MSVQYFFNSSNPEGVTQNDELKARITAQENLIKELKQPDFYYKDWLLHFSDFSKLYDRFLYSKISASIITEFDDDEVMSLVTNISNVIDHIDEDKNSTRDRQIKETDFINDRVTVSKTKFKLLYKLYDHCNLANTQKFAYQNTDATIVAKLDNRFEEKFKEKFDNFINPKLQDFQKDITTQLVSLVGIFTALSFVIFGGISVLDSLMDNIKTLPVLKVIFVGDLWMICMLNLFMLFTKLICKICDKQIDLTTICIWLNSITGGILLLIILGIMLKYGFWFLINTTVYI